jgi:selenocysteine-specific elongation factor
MLKQGSRGIKTGTRIRFYNNTQESIGRVTLVGSNELNPGDEGYVQFRLEQPVLIQHGDRFIIRFYSPLETLGGGMVLNPHPRRHRNSTMQESVKNLGILDKGSLDERLGVIVAGRALAGMEEAEVIGSVAADKAEILAALAALAQKKSIVRVDNLYVHTNHLAALEKKVLDLIAEFHKANSLKPGIDKEEVKGLIKIRLHPKALGMAIDGLIRKKQVEIEGSKLKLPGFRPAVGKDQGLYKDKIVEAIKKGGSQPPVRDEFPSLFGITDKDAKDLLKLLADEGRVVRINDSLYLDKAVLESIKTDLVKFLQEKKEIVVAEFRDIAKTSRKFAVPILEYLDSQKLTQRVGDKRVLRG